MSTTRRGGSEDAGSPGKAGPGVWVHRRGIHKRGKVKQTDTHLNHFDAKARAMAGSVLSMSYSSEGCSAITDHPLEASAQPLARSRATCVCGEGGGTKQEERDVVCATAKGGGGVRTGCV
jgi:hypothetical protein